MRSQVRRSLFVSLLVLSVAALACDDDPKTNNDNANNVNNVNNTNNAVCGNDVRETGEACDGDDLGGATCAGLGQGFTGGALACDDGCSLNTTGCTTGCIDACTLDETRCDTSGTALETCVTGASGCTEWSASPCAGSSPACAVVGGAPACVLRCPTTFNFTPGVAVGGVRIPGEWQGFDPDTAPQMTGPDGQGRYTATVELPVGLNAYKLFIQSGDLPGCPADGSGNAWCLDPGQVRRKYVGGVENSAVLVPDCGLPSLRVDERATTWDGPTGGFTAQLSFVDGLEGSGPDPAGYEATLTKDFSTRDLTAGEITVSAAGDVTLALADLAPGKYRVTLRPRTVSGRLGEPLRLIFWIEPTPFSWDGALVYMVMTDRFVDGESANNPGPTAGAAPTGDWHGGDLQGLAARIEDGTLDALGVRAIWLTPFQTNPDGAYLASDGVHLVTGYHGYWPVKAREVDPRIGGEQALRALVVAAHAHGIRILQDFVINHVHEDHEYNLSHPEWFRTGCVCGTAGCDWTSHALDCMFTAYMPDVDHTVPEANARFVDDAVWWLDELDLDGLRVDAVKHVEEIATRNLAAAVRETFEAAGTRYFLMGETAMGWSDCADPCNDENYGTIAKYIGPHGLDGQFDFVLYHGVSYRTFAWGDSGMLHADYWLQHGLSKWPEGAVMTPYLGSHDTSRFVSMADYRGQDGAHDRSIPGNQWTNLAVAPSDAEPHRRLRVGMTWLLGLPGAPLLYYGDEYGQWGGADPNNRLMWRDGADLTADEAETLDYVRRLGTARRELAALHHGAYVSLHVTEDTLVFARHVAATGDVALVGLTRLGTPQVVTVDVSALGLTAGTILGDHLSAATFSVAGDGTLTLSIPASSGVILAP